MKQRKLFEILTTEHLVVQSRLIFRDAQNWPNDSDMFIPGHLSMSQFKAMKDFYGSKDLLKYFVSVYVSRFARAYAINLRIPLESMVTQLMESEERELEAAEILQKEYIERYGSVSEERVKELDAIVAAWYEQDNAKLQQVLQSLKDGKTIEEAYEEKKTA